MVYTANRLHIRHNQSCARNILQLTQCHLVVSLVGSPKTLLCSVSTGNLNSEAGKPATLRPCARPFLCVLSVPTCQDSDQGASVAPSPISVSALGHCVGCEMCALQPGDPTGHPTRRWRGTPRFDPRRRFPCHPAHIWGGGNTGVLQSQYRGCGMFFQSPFDFRCIK